MKTNNILIVVAILCCFIPSCSFVPAGPPMGGPGMMYSGSRQGPGVMASGAMSGARHGPMQLQNRGYLLEHHVNGKIVAEDTFVNQTPTSPDGRQARITDDHLKLSQDEFSLLLQKLKTRR